VTQAQLDDLTQWQASEKFDPTQRAVLAYADAMTKDIHVSPEVFAGIKALMSERLIVELTATIGAYNMVSRFLEALQIHSHDAR